MPRLALPLALCCALLAAPRARAAAPPPRKVEVPDLARMMAARPSEVQFVARRYDTDRASLTRTYPLVMSPTRHARLERFHAEWLAALKKLDATKLSAPGRADL